MLKKLEILYKKVEDLSNVNLENNNVLMRTKINL